MALCPNVILRFNKAYDLPERPAGQSHSRWPAINDQPQARGRGRRSSEIHL